MAENSQIQWTEHTWNPWHGCTKVSPGCKFCYMYRDKERYGQDPTNVLRSKTKFRDPLKWKDPAKVFTCSWSDWFIEDADEWRPEAWQIVKDTPHLTYQILTKRPERIADHLPADWGDGYPNVWLGVSVENQEAFDSRVETLARTPAITRFLSIEPLLESLSIEPCFFYCSCGFPGVCHCTGVAIHWVIVGGESGNENGYYKYRPAELEWYAAIIKECQDIDVPVFMKQLGTHLAKQMHLKDSHGGDMSEWPADLRVREFPRR